MTREEFYEQIYGLLEEAEAQLPEGEYIELCDDVHTTAYERYDRLSNE